MRRTRLSLVTGPLLFISWPVGVSRGGNIATWPVIVKAAHR
jgi:hypothetical protein